MQLGEDFLHFTVSFDRCEGIPLPYFDGKNPEITENIKIAEKVTRRAGSQGIPGTGRS